MDEKASENSAANDGGDENTDPEVQQLLPWNGQRSRPIAFPRNSANSTSDPLLPPRPPPLSASPQKQQHKYQPYHSPGNWMHSFMSQITPPLLHHKEQLPLTMEEEKNKFHSKNQAFLQQTRQQRAASQTSLHNRSSSFRNSPTRHARTLSLASIENDIWDEDCDPEQRQRIELDMEEVHMHHAKNSDSFSSLDDRRHRSGAGGDASSVSSFPSISMESHSTPPDPPPAYLLDETIHHANKPSAFRGLDSMSSDESTPSFSSLSQQHRPEDSCSSSPQRRTELELRLQTVFSDEESSDEHQEYEQEDSAEDDHRQRHSHSKKKQFIMDYVNQLEREREQLLAQWKKEFVYQQKATKVEREPNPYVAAIADFLANAEVFIANLPLTIGAVALAWCIMGVVWFKLTEEIVDACHPVHYRSEVCRRQSILEFPGCEKCDFNDPVVAIAWYFHNTCSAISGLLCGLVLLKAVVAWKVVVDELSNPTTCAPFGVLSLCLVMVFAGRGWIGEVIVLVVSASHTLFSFWFLYMAVFQYKMLPDPSWFPSTVSLAYPAIKTWLYYPRAGEILLGLVIIYFCGAFFISFIRVALTPKISAPVAWIQICAPSITLYAISMMGQPSKAEDLRMEVDASFRQRFHDSHQEFYLRFEDVMMLLSIVGMVSAMHGLWTRWDKFKLKEFSPAHAAFAFPVLSHTNAVQVYRSSVNAFSNVPAGSAFKIALFVYWATCLLIGTSMCLIFTYMFMRRLPRWTKITVTSEEEPPAPSDTIVHEMLTDAREIMAQPFVSPAVLQANEAGALIRTRRGTVDYRVHGPYVRTRQVTALGFDPTLDDAEFRSERAALLDWVARNAPRTRHRTFSIPMFFKLKDEDYGSFTRSEASAAGGGPGHKRAKTLL